MRISTNRKPTHPGEILLHDFLEPMGLTQKEFARHLNWHKSYARLNEIVNGKRGVTPHTALSFAEAFSMEPDFWLNLQKNYDLWEASQTHKPVQPIQGTSA